MPKLEPIAVAEPPRTFSVVGNQDGSAQFATAADTFEGGELLIVTKRNVTAGQKTRKTSIRYSVPLLTVGDDPVETISRGSVLYSIDIVSPTSSTIAERTAALEVFRSLLETESLSTAVINNEGYFA